MSLRWFPPGRRGECVSGDASEEPVSPHRSRTGIWPAGGEEADMKFIEIKHLTSPGE